MAKRFDVRDAVALAEAPVEERQDDGDDHPANADRGDHPGDSRPTERPGDSDHGGDRHGDNGPGGGQDKHKGPGDGHGGRHGHGGNWLITYCDMVTLLVAFFICMLTFASNNTGNQLPRKRDSLLGGEGTGVAGRPHADQDAVVWRKLPLNPRLGEPGFEIPPLYSDPAWELTETVIKALDDAPVGLSDNFTMRLPLALFCNDDGQLSTTGQQFLRSLGHNVRALPYDVHIQVDNARNFPRAVTLARYLVQQQGLQPGRVGVGWRETNENGGASVWLSFLQRAGGD